MDQVDILTQQSLNRINTFGFQLERVGKQEREEYRGGMVPVDIEQYLEDAYYMGRVAKDLYPENKPELLDIFDPENNYIEVIFTGGTSIGKTFMACIAVTYIIYQLGCYADPHKWIGGSSASPIVGINMSINATKAKNVVFSRVKNMMDGSPYFRERFCRDMRLSDKLVWRISQTAADIAQRTGGTIEFVPGTGDSLSALGDDIFFGVGDELNFFRIIEKSKKAREERYDPAQKLYDTISRRMKGRFSAGGLPLGKFFLLSSAQYPDDFIERRIRESEADGSLGTTVKLIRKSVWEAKRGVFIQGKSVFSDKTFRVEVGSSRRGSRILDTYDRETGVVTAPECSDIEGKIVTPPIDFWDDYVRDIEGAVRDYDGETTRAVSPFFPDQTLLYEAEFDELKHPYSKFETTLRDGAILLQDVLFIPEMDEEGKQTGRLRLRRHPKSARYFHGDISYKNDEYGLAIVHIGGWMQVMHPTLRTLVDRPIIETDLMLRIVSPYGGEIQLDDIPLLFLRLRSLGMYFGFGTFDLRLLSKHTVQRMQAKAFKVDYLSMDRDLAPYQNLKEAFFDNRMRMYKFERDLVIEELGGLERQGDKVDHRPGSDKGLADALAGAVYNASQFEVRHSPEAINAKLPYMEQNVKKVDRMSLKEELADFGKWVRDG